MVTQLYEGLILYGFCNGYFGRDSYSPKRVEGYGRDWIAAREREDFETPSWEGRMVFATFKDNAQMMKLVNEWVGLTLPEVISRMTQDDLPDGVPCSHPGCLSHISHPCEGCGRIGGHRGS